MIAFNSIKYYSKLVKELDKINPSIIYILENNPVEERKEILKNVLNTKTNDKFYSIGDVDIDKLISNYKFEYRMFKQGFNILSFFSNLKEIKINFENLSNEYNYKDEVYDSLITHLSEMATLYQNIIQNETNDNIIIFFDYAEKICAEYVVVKKSLESCINSLGNSAYNLTNQTLELQLLDTSFNVGDFGDILILLNDAYNSIKRLCDENVEELQIIKIESGSLLSSVFGNDNIIELLGLIIHKIAKEMYQKFTINGKLEKQKNIMDLISSSADVIEKLDKLGINTGKSKSDIKDSLNIVTNNIYKIVTKTGKIKVNDDILCIEDSKKLLEYKTLLLEENKKQC